jgi:ornithine cyclodeaminase/alanine dehydrogenase-like protein (mu-crystallin family)
VRGADVIVTVTRSSEPLFVADVLSDRALICAVGATKYDRCEIGPDVVEACATVVCDDVAGSRVECGDLIRAAECGRFDWDRAVELHAVCAGTVTVARAGPAPVLFETQGVALQDVATAGLAWSRSGHAPSVAPLPAPQEDRA